MLILDTCAIIWDATEDATLSPFIQQKINQAEKLGELYICDISYWEVAMLVHKNRLNLSVSAEKFFDLYHRKRTLNIHAITATIAQRSVNFDKSVNNDPADRIITATTIEYNATLVTSDNNLRAFSQVRTLWQ